MLPNNPNTQIGHKARASTNGHGSERDYLRAQAKLAKQDFQRAAKGSVKSARRLLNIPAWVERSPFGTLAATFVVGYVTESCLGARSRSSAQIKGDQTEQSVDSSNQSRSNHRFITHLIERTLRQLIESSLIAWLFPAIMHRDAEPEVSQSSAPDLASSSSDTLPPSFEA